MKNVFATLQIAFLASTISSQSSRKPDNAVKASQRVLAPLVKLPAHHEQIQDPLTAETGFPAIISSGSKYFQDVYTAQVSPEVIEFGHVRETPTDWEQRFEKLNLKDLTRQGKVRWGDKHGGYGEQYWDYNHAGHDDHGEESRPQAKYTDYEPSQQESKQIPQKSAIKERPSYDIGTFDNIARPQRQITSTVNNDRGSAARQQRSPAASAQDDVEYISDGSKAAILSGRTGRHGGNYRREPRMERGKRERDEYQEAMEYDDFEK